MTDITITTGLARPRGRDDSDPAVTAGIRRRYRAERRFRAYGVLALLLAAAFLVVLIADILGKAAPAFTTHALNLEVAVPADLVPAERRGDPIAIRSADYFPLTRDALKRALPGVEGRAAERALTRLLSSGAVDALRSRIVADPSLIGTTVATPLLLSAGADLYFKGTETSISANPGRGIATPSGTTGSITILTAANDFAEDLVRVKLVLAERARAANVEAARLERAGSEAAHARAKEARADAAALEERFKTSKGEEPLDAQLPSLLVEINGGLVKINRLGDSRIEGEVLLPLTSTADAAGGTWRVVTYTVPESRRKIPDQQIAYLERFKALGKLERSFNWRFFGSGDSREPELAGIRGAVVGTALTLLVTLILSLPIGVMAAIYLEEFAPKNLFTDIIEVNINNLAAVPSIVFGLLGLAVFLNFAGFPRSAPLVGGMVLALMSLPTIIIATRAALKAVPPSIKEAALGVGASHQQAVFHHVLPLAMPGIMTGTIIAMAQALGETAPLLMIGMVAFIVDVPGGITDAATVLPVQIYLWSDLPELAFQYKTAAAIVVLLLFLFVMNGTAIWLRKRFERRW